MGTQHYVFRETDLSQPAQCCLQHLAACLYVSYKIQWFHDANPATLGFRAWFEELRDVRGRARIDRLSLGNPGDVKPVGSGVSELRIDYGPGYRIYFTQRGEDLIVLLAGGKKDTQARDIAQAIKLAAEL